MKTCRLLVRRSGINPNRARMLALGMSLLPVLACAQVTYTPYTFATLAGKASIGSADGPAATARFSSPVDVAVDRSGNLYVADTENHTIRKITPDGMVTTLAGTAGLSGWYDGVGSAARFYWPQGIAVDTYGNVYVADTYNQTIRKIAPGGAVTTFAGRALSNGNLDGTGTAASFNYPSGVAVDATGNLYVTETFNDDMRKITPAGVVTTFAGMAGSGGDADGVGTAAHFSSPRGVAVDAWGNLYVADSLNDRIRKITPDGSVTTLRMADGTIAAFDRPQKLGVDMVGNIYVSESSSHRVLRLTPAGELTTLATLPTDLPLDPASVPYADGVAVDVLGNVLVADTGNSAIRKITPAGVLTTVAGFGPGFGAGDGVGSAARFYYPDGVAVDGTGNVYVADTANHAVRKITSGGVVTTLVRWIPSPETGRPAFAVRLVERAAVAVDTGGNVYVADTVEHTVRKITAAGVVTTLAGMAGEYGSVDGPGSAARFVYPHGLAVDASGNVLVADFLSAQAYANVRTIRKITPGGEVTTPVQLWNAPGSLAHLPMPLGIAIDGAGNIFAAESYSAVIWKIPPSGAASIIAGVVVNGGQSSIDGVGAAIRFQDPTSLALDTAGNIYLTDYNSIRRLTPDGVATTLAGVSGLRGSSDGVSSTARFDSPSGIAVDNAGRLYVADTDNHTIRMGVAASAPVILTQPQSQSAASGTNVQFSVTVAGVPEPTLQWFRNGFVLSGATGSTLTLTGVFSSDAGDYTVTASNDLGRVTSNKATLTVSAATAATLSSSGGGGAVEAWFVVGLVLLGTARIMTRRCEIAW